MDTTLAGLFYHSPPSTTIIFCQNILRYCSFFFKVIVLLKKRKPTFHVFDEVKMKVVKLGHFPEIVLRAGLLLDGTGLPPVKNAAITIEKGVIRRILPAGAVPPGAGEIDCGNLTILPGLVDCHVHLALDGVNFEESLKRWNDREALAEHLAASLVETLNAGVLAVRDGGDRSSVGLEAGRLAGRENVPPLILPTGRALRKKGGYGSFLGAGLTASRIRAAVREVAAAGGAQVKVLVSGIVSFREYGKVGPLQFSREELQTLVSEAHCLGLRVMAHANSGEGASLAVQCGVDSLEHGYFVSEDTLARMAETGAAWVPTIIPVAARVREPLKSSHSPAGLDVIEKTYRRQQKMVEIARRLGVTIGVGTDAGASGVRHGLSYIEELKLLAESGLPPGEVIRAATANGAAILGLADTLGRVAPGMKAYLAGYRGDPLKDINILKNPDAVFIP
jgi:imidazolonepropionase-like amidohydrolase